MAEIPPLIIPVIPQTPIPPPTRGMMAPPTRGMTPPTAIIPEINAPTLNLPPTTFSNPDPGTPQSGPSVPQQQQESAQEEDTRDMPAEVQMAPFDASTQIDFTVPIIDVPVSIPVPRAAVVMTAGTTAMTAAFAATGAAIFAKPFF